ncbi:MAG: VWA domain-containing protein, partial [Bacteroidetes bacterium]|nr:VWA domain-containing protein [Bacteroidota bacterium]
MRYTPLYSIVVAGIVLLTCSPPRIPAQSLSLFDIDARAYPLMRAQWYAFDTHGARLSDLTPEDFSLTENGETRRIIHASCPPHSPQVPLSAVLTLDVSGSMDGIPLDIARAAAEAWLEVFPFHTSACALTSFTMTNALLQDFTNDRAALADALQLLRAGGGTSFSAALIDPFAGALRVVQRGERKRVVVLLTDGYATGNAAEIFGMARQVDAEVYCVTMEDRMPDLL